MAVVEQVFADKTGVRLFADNVIADGVSNSRRCAARRPLLENLRIAGVIVGVNQIPGGRTAYSLFYPDALRIIFVGSGCPVDSN